LAADRVSDVKALTWALRIDAACMGAFWLADSKLLYCICRAEETAKEVCQPVVDESIGSRGRREREVAAEGKGKGKGEEEGEGEGEGEGEDKVTCY